MDQRPKYKSYTIKLLEKNIGVNHCDLRLGNIFLSTFQTPHLLIAVSLGSGCQHLNLGDTNIRTIAGVQHKNP